MLVVMVRIPVSSEEEGENLANRFRNRAGLVDSQPGFMGFELLKGDGEYISVTRWEDQASLDAWTSSQAHEQTHSGTRPAARPAGTVSAYEVVIPSSR